MTCDAALGAYPKHQPLQNPENLGSRSFEALHGVRKQELTLTNGLGMFFRFGSAGCGEQKLVGGYFD